MAELPPVDLLKEMNICGRDLAKNALFDSFFGELNTAPMIKECPINIECEVL